MTIVHGILFGGALAETAVWFVGERLCRRNPSPAFKRVLWLNFVVIVALVLGGILL